jgi:hypothetical protein
MSVMLPPDIEAEVLKEAEAKGTDPETIIREIWYLARRAKARERKRPEDLTPEEREEILDRIAARVRPHPPLSDEAISRESIYTREDEML